MSFARSRRMAAPRLGGRIIVGKLARHVSVRSFMKHDRKTAGFHDRYLITPEREILISHSLNGWCRDGVTFVSLPYGVYRAEAERLWGMDIESDAEALWVREVS